MTAEHIDQLRNPYRGALLGLECGDALGTTLEFHPPSTSNPFVTMIGGGPFRLKAGEWTDDTSMALCLSESLVECGGFEPWIHNALRLKVHGASAALKDRV